ncbi:MAG: L-2-hydroxyglutarate oxidase [Lysobacterales bacterium]|jgi:L-2-hydroxyglutarate oxidase
MKHDVIIIGAGIVGLATAREIQRRWPRLRLLLLEKEAGPARHQSGHNSGVVHAGVYYEPGSLKARLCREGLAATHEFCLRHSLPFRRPGKLVVATDEAESHRLRDLFLRCRQNGLEPEMLEAGALMDLEPQVRGHSAMLVRETAIVDYPLICRILADGIRDNGGEIRYRCRVSGLSEADGSVRVQWGGGEAQAGTLVVCAGLMADRMASLQGLQPRFRIVPYRGEYYRLRRGLEEWVHHLVYPVPDPALPFLGVHLTPTVEGTITVGPNAVQGWKREGYGRVNFSFRDTASMLTFPGFWRATRRYFTHGLRETWNATFKRAYLAQVRKYSPRLQLADLEPWPAGIRAQAMLRDGTLIHDFLFEETQRSLHVCNAPSPAATSAIPIAREICSRLAPKLA